MYKETVQELPRPQSLSKGGEENEKKLRSCFKFPRAENRALYKDILISIISQHFNIIMQPVNILRMHLCVQLSARALKF